MAEDDKKKEQTPPLSERANRYREEIEKVVREVGEHPLFELKRVCDLTNLEGKIELVKDVQSICTSRIEFEKYLVIGADARARGFVNVENLDEFDEAKLKERLGKYLQPVPQFEVFALRSSDDRNFVLLVFPRQRTRRILAKVSVDHPVEKTQKLLLRQGDLWTKGDSTAKRLATNEDWDEIYADAIELETEKRTRQRTAHLLERATAQEKLRPSLGAIAVPNLTSDEEFKALIEDICASADRPRFSLLLENLRDDLIESWYLIGAFGPDDFEGIQKSLSEHATRTRDHKRNVFMPAMQRLAAAGIYVIKNSGPPEFMSMVGQLLQEVYDIARQLSNLRWLGPRGLLSSNSPEHLTHTIPALESLVSLHLIGAYATKRGRLEYLAPLIRITVQEAGEDPPRDLIKPMALWPLGRGWGEPGILKTTSGRIELCAQRVRIDPVLLRLFGSEAAAIQALCAYELILELNSFLAVDQNRTPESVAMMKRRYPTVDFAFIPGATAFPLEDIAPTAQRLLSAMKRGDGEFLKPLLFDPDLVGFLIAREGLAFAKVLRGLLVERERYQSYRGMWGFGTNWPKDLHDAVSREEAADSTPVR